MILTNLISTVKSYQYYPTKYRQHKTILDNIQLKYKTHSNPSLLPLKSKDPNFFQTVQSLSALRISAQCLRSRHPSYQTFNPIHLPEYLH